MRTLVCFLVLSGVCMGQYGGTIPGSIPLKPGTNETDYERLSYEAQQQRNLLLHQQLWQQDLARRQALAIEAQRRNDAAQVRERAERDDSLSPRPPITVTPKVYIYETPPEVKKELEDLRTEVSMKRSAFFTERDEARKYHDKYLAMRKQYRHIEKMVRGGMSQEKIIEEFERSQKERNW